MTDHETFQLLAAKQIGERLTTAEEAAPTESRDPVCPDRWDEVMPEQRDCPGPQGVGVRMMPRGVHDFDSVIERPHAGCGPQPVRRCRRQLRIGQLGIDTKREENEHKEKVAHRRALCGRAAAGGR